MYLKLMISKYSSQDTLSKLNSLVMNNNRFLNPEITFSLGYILSNGGKKHYDYRLQSNKLSSKYQMLLYHIYMLI